MKYTYKKARDIVVGDVLRMVDNTTAKVVSISPGMLRGMLLFEFGPLHWEHVHPTTQVCVVLKSKP